MRSKLLMLAASAAIAVTAPAVAQEENPGRANREQARQNSQGPDRANERGVERSNENSVLHDGESDGDGTRDRRSNSQGSANASDRGRERASQNSAVREGMEVRDRNGWRVGQVREVHRSPDGTIVAIVVVLVVQINGTNVITLPAGSFTIVGAVVVINSISLSTGS